MGLETVEFLLHVEEEFDLEIPDDVAEQIETVGMLHEYVMHNSPVVSTGEIGADKVWQKLVEIAALQLDAPKEKVLPETRFVDLYRELSVCPRLGF